MKRTRNRLLPSYNFPQVLPAQAVPRSLRQVTRRLSISPATTYDWQKTWRDFIKMPRPEFDAMVRDVVREAGPELQREARIARTNLDARGLGQLGALELLLKLGVLLNALEKEQ